VGEEGPAISILMGEREGMPAERGGGVWGKKRGRKKLRPAPPKGTGGKGGGVTEPLIAKGGK